MWQMMKIKTVFSGAALFLITSTIMVHAGSKEITTEQYKPLNSVRVSMQRMLKSSEGRYFLRLNAGITKPHATLYDFVENKNIDFKGTQKGDEIVLDSVEFNESLAKSVYKIVGTLNSNSGVFQSNLISNINGNEKKIQFEPAFKVENKPVFIFKFYGNNVNTDGERLTRVDVLNKINRNVVQTLTGFSAYSKSMGYMDINFDGYYDVLLSDLSEGKSVEDKRYIYWMYNPKIQKYQRSPQLEKIVGFPTLHGERKQIDFGNGQVYQVENGLLNKIN